MKELVPTNQVQNSLKHFDSYYLQPCEKSLFTTKHDSANNLCVHNVIHIHKLVIWNPHNPLQYFQICLGICIYGLTHIEFEFTLWRQSVLGYLPTMWFVSTQVASTCQLSVARLPNTLLDSHGPTLTFVRSPHSGTKHALQLRPPITTYCLHTILNLTCVPKLVASGSCKMHFCFCKIKLAIHM